MTIFFANAEPIDLEAIAIMGVNVKEGPSPIGYFGTGLKFAIATLLREGQGIVLWRAGKRYEFKAAGLVIRGKGIVLWRAGKRYEFKAAGLVIRGKGFARVVMLGPEGEVTPLGFTTELGRNWGLAQALRELESNCRDEGGQSGEAKPEGEFGTIFEIEGAAFAKCYREELPKIFLDKSRKPLFETDSVQIFARRPDDEKTMMFYRGVRAFALNLPSGFLYNLKRGELTEDRSIKNPYHVAMQIAYSWADAAEDAEGALRKMLTQGELYWEHNGLNTWPFALSEPFQDIIKDLRGDARLNPHAYQAWLQLGKNEELEWEKAKVTPALLAQWGEAQVLLRKLGVEVDISEVTVVESLGNDTYGMARGRKMFISLRAFDMGTRFLASTIYEEFLHAKRGLMDESRGMQNFLFEKLFALLDGQSLDDRLEKAGIQEAKGTTPEIDDDIPF